MAAPAGLEGYTIRRLTAEHEAQVRELCRAAVSWEDYVPRIFSRWVAEPQAEVLGSFEGERLVAMARYSLQEDGTAWFEGARVHPQHRNRGLATTLARELMKRATLRGARVARLITSQDNLPARRHLEKLGFRVRGKWLIAELARAERAVHEPTTPSDARSLWRGLRRSAGYLRGAGLYGISSTFYRLNEPALRRFVGEGGVWAVRGGLALLAQGDQEKDGRKSLQVSFASGNARALRQLLALLVHRAHAQGLAAYAHLPATRAAQQALGSLSPPWSFTALVYERRLTAGGLDGLASP